MRDSVWLLALGLLVVGGAALAVRNKAPPPPAIQPDGPVPYARPPWVPAAVAAPATRLHLAHLPTPVHRWRPPGASNAELYIKRDDCSGSELSGNKVRKLEFLLADAIAKDATAVVTVGGIQSNHCRATAAAARRVGLEPHVVLRTAAPRDDPGLEGNLLVDRAVGATLHLVGEAVFAERGGAGLVDDVVAALDQSGARAYGFPSGGSNALGTWGYVEFVAELERQVGSFFDRVYFACGSGGTAAGLALGLKWSNLGAELVGLCVDDDPDFFYDKLDGLFAELGATEKSRDLLRLEDCVGAGYAASTAAELEFLAATAAATGVVLDPVYSGKAARGMVADLAARPCGPALLIHTGGLLGLYPKADQLKDALGGASWGELKR